MNYFRIELDGFFCLTKINFAKPAPLPTSKLELFVTILDSSKLFTSVASSLDPSLLNYDFQRTEEGCSAWWETSFRFFSSPKRNQDFNETILETLSMPEKALKMPLNVVISTRLA